MRSTFYKSLTYMRNCDTVVWYTGYIPLTYGDNIFIFNVFSECAYKTFLSFGIGRFLLLGLSPILWHHI